MKTSKRLFWVVLLTALTVTAYSQQYDPESDFKVEKSRDGKSVTITEYAGSKKVVRIPPKIQGLPVTGIGKNAFNGLDGLTSITIPNGVTSIGDEAFNRCTSLASVTIPSSVTSIGEAAFAGCVRLSALNVAAGNTAYISENGVLYNKAKTTLMQYPAGKTGSTFTIPTSVTAIGGGAFRFARLTSVTIPNSVTSIGWGAFSFSNLITSVTIGNGVTSIGDFAFEGLNGLASVTIPNSVTSIGDGAFLDCASLTSVTFQGSISAGNFSNDWWSFPGDLRDKFYATDAINGTPGTYTRASGGTTWEKQ